MLPVPSSSCAGEAVEPLLFVGASLGANSSLVAASTSEPSVDAVVAISPAESTELEEAAGLLEMPVLLVTTQDDPIGSSRAATELLFDLLLG
jgi:predicted esterase